MLRITRTEDSLPAITFRLEGRIAGEWVAVLEEESRRTLGEGREVVLDCAEVTFIDADGREMLRQMMCERVRLVHVSPLLASLLVGDPATR